jgi:heavy metal efflux system protein
LMEKRKLLQRADTLYASFLQKQELRFRAGDANVVEKAAAEAQRMQVANQLQQLEADFAIMQTHFNYLLNSNESLLPEADTLKLPVEYLPEATAVKQYPIVQWKQQQQQVALQELQLNKARLLPHINLGYNNQSIIGIQNVDGAEKYFGSSKRFSSAMAGISIPLFNSAGKARIAWSRTRYLLAQKEYEEAEALQRSELDQLLKRYRKNKATLDYFETSALNQARILTENATLQFNNGDINYLEYILLINQSVGLQSAYMDAITDWNETIIELNTYSSNY